MSWASGTLAARAFRARTRASSWASACPARLKRTYKGSAVTGSLPPSRISFIRATSGSMPSNVELRRRMPYANAVTDFADFAALQVAKVVGQVGHDTPGGGQGINKIGHVFGLHDLAGDFRSRQ